MQIGIFLNGLYEEQDKDYYVQQAQSLDKIIVTDEAGELLKHWGIRRDLAVGDFDKGLKTRKIDADQYRWYIHNKDKTDGELAVEAALQENPRKVILYGYLPREHEYDHFLGNLGLLYDVLTTKTGIGVHREAVARAPVMDTYLITTGTPSAAFSAKKGDIVSLVAYGCSSAASTHTIVLILQVNNHEIFFNSGRLLRNKAIKEEVEVYFDDTHLGHRGNLLVFHHKKFSPSKGEA